MTKDAQNTNKEICEEQTLYGVSASLIHDIKQALETSDTERVLEITETLHHADVADLISRLSYDLRTQYIAVIQHRIAPEVLAYLEDQTKKEVLLQMGATGVAALIEQLDSDDALQLIQDLDYEFQKDILRAVSPTERAMLEEGLTYPADSAGRLMQREIVCIPTFWTIREVIDFIREAPHLPESFHNIYVVDPKYRPVGYLPVDKVLREKPARPISEIVVQEIKTIPVEMDQEEVAQIFKHYGLVSAPVIDENGRIIGMITVDDIVGVIEEEAEEDIFHLGGVKESDFNEPLLKTAYWRIRWLIISLVSALIASRVIAAFEKTIEQKVYLAFLMVIVSAMAGNTALQTVTVTVRAIATREFKAGQMWYVIGKQLGVSALTGLFFALILGIVTFLWIDEYVALVLSAALFFNILMSGLTGVMLPLIADHLGLDPALSSPPLVATLTDSISYASFLGFATYFLL